MLSFQIDTNSDEPLYEQIYNNIKKLILDGTYPNGSKLPSTRNMSVILNVSRNTVDTAYYQLMSEGYIDSVPKSGFYVNDISLAHHTSDENSDNNENSASNNNDISEYDYDFSPFEVDISHFPYSVWKRLSKQILNSTPDLFLLGDAFGDISLRRAICEYVRLSREVSCTPEQIIVGAGADYLLQMLSLMFCHMGVSEITMENPCYVKAAQIFKNNYINVHPGELDYKGLIISSISEKSNIVYVTPSHEYPLGIVMPFGRRKELLDWACQQENRYIIEDDHDSEFRYKGKPIPSLQGIDSHSKVIYSGTFSKAIAPAIRVGYIILPPALLGKYKQICGHYSCTVSRFDQAILANFISQGYFEKHINRMRKIYKSKHDTVLKTLEKYISENNLSVSGDHAGMHIVLTLPENVSSEEVCHLAREEKIHVYSIKEHYLSIPDNAPDSLLIGYSNLSEEDIKTGLAKLISICNYLESQATGHL